MTTLQAINEILRAIDLPPIAAVPSTASDTTSIGARAEDELTTATRQVLTQGYPCNTTFSRSYTLDSNGEVDVSAADPAVLRIRGVSPAQFKDSLFLRGGKFWDQRLGQTDLGNQNDIIYVDVIEELAFVDVSPDVQEIIVSQARIKFQRQHQGSQANDAFLQQEHAEAEVDATRNKTEMAGFGTRPLIPQQASDNR